MSEGSTGAEATAAQELSPPPFVDVASEVGLHFIHDTGATGELYFPEIMGSGCALLDYDRDGDLDVYAVQGTRLAGTGEVSEASIPPPPPDGPTNRLFRNELIGDAGGGSLSFVDVTAEAGAGDRHFGMGVAVGDIDNDGDPDMYVTNVGPNVLYVNQGDGTFRDVTESAGVGDAAWSTSAAFVDIDADGWLDLYVVNYVDFDVRRNHRCYTPAGARDYCSPQSYHPVTDRLYRNRGDGLFEDVSESSGITAETGSGLGVGCDDFNRDGHVDIFVANDGEPNHLWINRGDGTFVNRGLISGCALSATGEPEGCMGVAVGDYDTDGDSDIFVTNLKGETNTLYRNDGQGYFDDVTSATGVRTDLRIFTGFGTEWIDYDLDGRDDLFVTNGAVTALEWLSGDPYPYHQNDRLLRHLEDGTFEEVSAKSGPAFEASYVGRGAAFGDIDNDGDTDIVVSNNRGPMQLLRNMADDARPWIGFELSNDKGPADGTGSRLTLFVNGQRIATRRVHTDGSYLAASDGRVVFAVSRNPGPKGGADRHTMLSISVEAQWPDGMLESWDDPAPYRYHRLTRNSGKSVP